MKNLLFLFFIAIIFYFFIEKNKYGCESLHEFIQEDYGGIIKKKFIVKSDYNYEIEIGKNVKKIYGVNENVDNYLIEGDSIHKIKGFNRCIVYRKGAKKYFSKYLDLKYEKYCDSIEKIKSK